MAEQFIQFIKYYGKNKKSGIFFFLLISVFAGFLEFAGIGLVYPFLVMITNYQNLAGNVYYEQFVKITTFDNVFFNTLIIAFFIVLMFVLKNLIMILCVYLQNKFVINWKNDINKMIMRYYLNISYKNLFENTSSEKIYNLTVLSSQTLETFVMRTLVFVTNSIIILLILILLFLKFTIIAIFTTIFVILCMICLNKFFKHKTEILAPKMLESSLKNNNQVIENIKNLKEIRIFSAEEYFLNKFEKVQSENNNVIFKNAFYAGISPYIVEMLLVFALIILAGFITYQNFGDSSKIIASYGLILAVIFRLAPSLNRIQIALNHMNASKDMIKKMNDEYKKNKFDVIETVNKTLEDIDFKEVLKLENVSFSYKLENPVIKNITLNINKGEFIGITGLSGSGKTTLADILMGILPVDSGKIILDNTEIDDSNILAYRKLICYVPQEVNILDSTYKNNVAWGKEEIDIDETRVRVCLKEAQLYDFVEKEGGIDSLIKGLSQGQKQRLAIARALYENPQIIIFDEATSSLDVETEHEIVQMLKSVKGEKTIIAIAHRLSTIKECDRLIYINDGIIGGIDTFENLRQSNKDFEKLINLSKF